MLETCASEPLFRHSHAMTHLSKEQNMVMEDPGFQNDCKECMSVLAYFVFCIFFIIYSIIIEVVRYTTGIP